MWCDVQSTLDYASSLLCSIRQQGSEDFTFAVITKDITFDTCSHRPLPLNHILDCHVPFLYDLQCPTGKITSQMALIYNRCIYYVLLKYMRPD